MVQNNEIPALPAGREAQRELLERLITTEQGGELSAADVREVLMRKFGDEAREAATVVSPELTPEVLAECLAGMERDYKRGIVVVDEAKGMDDFKAALKEDKTAGTPWGTIKGKLEADNGGLLKEAAKLQGKGTLIGVYPDGKLCIKDRGNEPVIFATLDGRQIEITIDSPNRAELMERVKREGQFANYWEIRSAVHGKGLELPPDSPTYVKLGAVAAAEAVTGEDFVRSTNGNEWRSVILECGDVSRSSSVRVVIFFPRFRCARVYDDDPLFRDADRGAVRVLRG